jgi:hypothetical protein
MPLPSSHINELAKRCTGTAFCQLAAKGDDERISLYVLIPTTQEYDLVTDTRASLRDFILTTVGVHAVAPIGEFKQPEAFVPLANFNPRP